MTGVAPDSHGLVVLCTHGHADHIQGLPDLQRRFPHLVSLSHGTSDAHLPLLDGHLRVALHATPCHTRDSVCALVSDADDAAPSILFSGDTLFAFGGCGRFFQGSADDFFPIATYVRSLPPATRLCGGHAYSASNAKFLKAICATVDVPEFAAVAELVAATPDIDLAPRSLKDEIAGNPFLSFDRPEVIRAVEIHTGKPATSPSSVIAGLRAWKNSL
eukprot:gnl/Ergobibamus_cyprinoides/465.p1 GENE.gnl/Ergobibamus_cyprinoides/465~~gnl/Ergobibamus_cyprinoides/465.p1  ORF type:complete len:217 (+),score=34.24 gnl/Ergobibamus_cyprinoides/465:159-809(+)